MGRELELYHLKTAWFETVDVFHYDIERMKKLINEGIDVNFRSKSGTTNLIFAAFCGYLDVVQLLLDNGADPNLQNNEGNTALMRAAYRGHIEIVRLLLEKGADPNLQNNDGNTALMNAIDKGHTEIVKLLLENGAQFNLSIVGVKSEIAQLLKRYMKAQKSEEDIFNQLLKLAEDKKDEKYKKIVTEIIEEYKESEQNTISE